MSRSARSEPSIPPSAGRSATPPAASRSRSPTIHPPAGPTLRAGQRAHHAQLQRRRRSRRACRRVADASRSALATRTRSTSSRAASSPTATGWPTTGMLDISWRWLPKTAVFFQASAGYIHYLSSSAEAAGKSNSIPYRVLTGLRGLDHAQADPGGRRRLRRRHLRQRGGQPQRRQQPGGAGSGLTFNATELTTFGLSYAHEFRDSPVLGNYYDMDARRPGHRPAHRSGPAAGGRPLRVPAVPGFPDGGARSTGRITIFQARVSADYQLQRWFYAGVSYATLISRSGDPRAPRPASSSPRPTSPSTSCSAGWGSPTDWRGCLMTNSLAAPEATALLLAIVCESGRHD